MALLWAAQIQERFPRGATVLVCHGNELGGAWWLFPDPPRLAMPVAYAAWVIHDLIPGKPLVLLVCNPTHRIVRVPDTFYADGKVYVIPDDRLPFPRFGGVGSIDKFHD